MEEWKDMPGFEGYYEISNIGNARSKERRYVNKSGYTVTKHGKALKPIVGTNGYIRYGLKLPDDTKVYKVLAHRMVALAFIPNPNNLPDVGHWDDIRDNNCINNLYWTSKSDNIIKAVKSNRLDFSNISKSTTKYTYKIDGSDKEYTANELAKVLGCTVGNIYVSIKNNTKCCGHSIERVENISNHNVADLNIKSDEYINSCVDAQGIILEKDGIEIYANSINSAANKINRSASSVSKALRDGTLCNGYKVYKSCL